MKRTTRRTAALGFTLIEVMVAALIGSISILVAAKVAQVVIQQSTKGRERTDFHTRARAFTRQLKADIRNAGYGSTGSIAFDGSAGFLGVGGLSYLTTVNGYPAIPAVTGANNIGAVGVNGITSQAGTDAIQLVVPDPSTSVRSMSYGNSPGSLMQMETAAIGGCSAIGSLVYILDHSGPTGAGRAQLAFLALDWTSANLTLQGGFQFTAAPGSRVMCARISTYWVDNQGWLHRSDITNQGDTATNLGGSVYVNNNAAPTDGISPGVADLQIAYGMSAQWALANPGAASPLDPRDRHGFDASGPAIPNGEAWAEVRTIRFNLLTRTLRRIDSPAANHVIVPREDGVVPAVPISRVHAVEWITSTEVLTSLRYFDEISTVGMPADPY